jgi:hypothetical protein
VYHTNKALSSTLYGGDRAGSRYYFVLENTAATESANFTSGGGLSARHYPATVTSIPYGRIRNPANQL